MNRLPFNRPLAAVVLLAFCVNVGCSTVRTVPASQGNAQSETIADLHGRVDGKTLTVKLVPTDVTSHDVRTWGHLGSKWTASASELRVEPDSIYWRDSEAGEPRQVSWSQVETITLLDHRRGAVEGLGIGLVIGAVLGALVGFLQGDDPEQNFVELSAGEKAALGAIVVGAIGGLVGLALGFGDGHKYVYQFGQSRNTRDQTP